MTDPSRVPTGINPNVPNAARMYDCYLGGKDNFAADREAAGKVMALAPIKEICLANRRFLSRSVRYAATRGIDQFIDLGTGLPSLNSVHQVARETHPEARVVHVDHDPVVVVHARALLAGTDPYLTTVHADVREPASILDAPATRKLIDFNRPVGLVLLGVLHHLTDEDDPWGVVAAFRERLAPGSALILSHATDDAHPEVGKAVRKVYDEVDAPLVHRGHEQVTRMFEGFEAVEPGVTHVADWRPDGVGFAGSEWWYVGVAHKP